MIRNIILLAIFYAQPTLSQSIFGKWKTIDDETQQVRSIIEIGMENGEIYGRIKKVFLQPGDDPSLICKKCSKNDPRYNKSIIDMNIFENVHKKEGEDYWEGKILDPKKGKVYSLRLWLEEGNLKIRGYWAFFYRTQTWRPYRL